MSRRHPLADEGTQAIPLTPEATMYDEGGHTVIRFERGLRHPPERVWSALTKAGELAAWHPSPFELDPRAGGAVRYQPPFDHAIGDGTVIAYEPSRLLAHTWGEDTLRWELRPYAEGTLLVLTQTFDDHFKAARDAAGWHLCLDALAGALDGAGAAAPAPTGERAIPAGWPELNAAYEERFGISPDEATPPPVG
jgi:uncharacterized protein YndB with AHSA1/START domain